MKIFGPEFNILTHTRLITASLALLLATAAVAQDPKQPTQAARDTFKNNCSLCHGTAGEGSEMGLSMGVKILPSKEVQDMSDADLIKTITKGNGSMPGFGTKFSQEELDALITLIRSFKAKPAATN